MMRKKITHLFLLYIALLHSSAGAIILESDSLQDIYKHLDQTSIVVFDIDNTLTKVSPAIEPWVHYKTSELEKQGLQHDEAFHFVLAMFFVISEITDLLPIGNSPTIVRDLQKKKNPVIALTNRSIPVAKKTIQELKEVGIDLSKNNLLSKPINISDTHAGLYSDGIIFTGSNDKGRMLFLFFDAANYKPKKIIFVDDRQKNVESVEAACKLHNVECICLRISLMDETKKAFNPAQAEKTIYELKQQLGFEPLGKFEIEKKQTWPEKLWKIVSWPFKKLWSLL